MRAPLALALAVCVATPAAAAPPSPADPPEARTPLPSVTDEPGHAEPPEAEQPEAEQPEAEQPETEQSEPGDSSSPASAPAAEDSAQVASPAESRDSPEPPPPTLQEPEVVRVAVGLSPELDGSKDEKARLDQLERSVAASPAPRANVRRLRVGTAEPIEVCREGRDDLVITVGYLPDRAEPVLLTRDCRIDQELGVRQAIAAEDPDLLGVLWDEHRDRVAKGARERRRARISPKVRTGLIAGAAVAVIGVAVGLLIAGAVRRETVVLVVSPNP